MSGIFKSILHGGYCVGIFSGLKLHIFFVKVPFSPAFDALFGVDVASSSLDIAFCQKEVLLPRMLSPRSGHRLIGKFLDFCVVHYFCRSVAGEALAFFLGIFT